MEEHKISAKRPDTGKWWQYGGIKQTSYGNWQASVKVTPELKALIEANDGKWINFALFAVDEKTKPEKIVSKDTQKSLNELLDDSIPF